MKSFALLILCVFAPALRAQSATTQVTLSWTVPTQNTDGTSISGTISYNLYEATSSSGPWTKVQGELAATTEQLSTIAAGNCFAITAVVAGIESGMSSAACIEQPKAPTALTTSVVLILTSQ